VRCGGIKEKAAEPWWACCQCLKDESGEVNLQIIINVDFYSVIKSIVLGERLALKEIYGDGLVCWIDNPVFTNTCHLVPV